MELPHDVSVHHATTSRLSMRYFESGPSDGIPIIFVHGNLATGRFFEHIMAGAPQKYRFIAPDMRGFGGSDKVAIDGSRGLRDWADDTRSLVEHLGISQPAHLVGWSTGGGAIMQYLIDHPNDVASLTLIDTVSPYGFGGTKNDAGEPAYADYAGSGGGSGNPEFAGLLAAGDAGTDSDFSPRNVMRGFYWSPEYTMDPAQEDMLVAEVLMSLTGTEGIQGIRSLQTTGRASLQARRAFLTRCLVGISIRRASWTHRTSHRSCGLVDPLTWSSPTARPGRWARWDHLA